MILIFVLVLLASSAYASNLEPGKLWINSVEIPYSVEETQCISGIKGNANSDNNVDVYDLLEMFKILQNGLTGRVCCCCIDLNNDNIVNTLDLTKLLSLIQSGEINRCGEENNRITGNVLKSQSLQVEPYIDEEGITCGNKGDLNNDNKIDIFDLLKLLKALNDKALYSENENKCADIKSDEKIDVFDLLGLLSLLKGEEKEAYISIATTRYSYNTGENIEITDPLTFSGPGAKKIKYRFSHKEDIPTEAEEVGALGYIVEFKDEPIIKKEIELENQKQKDAAALAGMSDYNPLKYLKQITAVTEENIDDKLGEHTRKIEDIHNMFEREVASLLGKPLNKITGNAVKSNEAIVVNNEYKDIFNGIALDITKEQAEEIKKLNYVKNVYKNQPVKASLIDSVPLIKANIVQDIGLKGEDITIAIIDTGIDVTHPSLDDLDDDPETNDPKIIGFKDFINFRTKAYDDAGHGTHVADTAAGTGGGTGYIGVAPKANLVGVKVLDEGGYGSFSGVIAGMEWVAQNKNKYNIRVASMSLGARINSDGTSPSEIAADLLVDYGVVLVVAAGNEGPYSNTVGIPASANKVITVGAVDKNLEIAEFSSRGPTQDNRLKPDVVAPGVGICAAQYDEWLEGEECNPEVEKHIAISGTSMATPHVSGVAALILQANPNLSPLEVKEILHQTSIDLGENGPDNTYGYGVVNVLKAIIKVNPPGNEISVNKININNWVEVNSNAAVKAIIENNGLNAQNINTHFFVNNEEKENRNVFVNSQSSQETIFNWQPVKEGDYKVKIVLDKIENELTTENNQLTKNVRVVKVEGSVDVAVIRSWGTDYSQYTIFDELNKNWFNYGNYIVNIDYQTLNKEDVTYDDLIAKNADVIVISNAWANGFREMYHEYNDLEINGIKEYTEEGHGLIGTSGTLNTDVPNNIKLASLFGLKEKAGTWAEAYDNYFYLLTNDKILTNKLPNEFSSGIRDTISGLEVDNEVPVALVAESRDKKAFVTAYRPKNGASMYFTHIIEEDFANEYDKQLFYNSLIWSKLNSGVQQHDLAIYNLDIPDRIIFNQDITANVKIKNIGLNKEENIKVSLLIDDQEIENKIINSIDVNEEINISFSWKAESESDKIMAIKIDEVNGENVKFNNYISKKIIISGAYLTDSYYDYGIDGDEDGKYDKLIVEGVVEVLKEGYYVACADLISLFGAEIERSCGSIELKEGYRNIKFIFDALNIRKFGLNGPYKIKNLELRDGNNNIVDEREEAYTTKEYSIEEFESGSDLYIDELNYIDRIFLNIYSAVNIIIKNQGIEDAKNATISLYESSLYEEGEILTYKDGLYLGEVPAGETREINLNIDARDTPDHIRYVLEVNSSNDMNNENNIEYFDIYFIPEGPDLRIYAGFRDLTATLNEEVDLPISMYNYGTEKAENITLYFYDIKESEGYWFKLDEEEIIEFDNKEHNVKISRIDDKKTKVFFDSQEFILYENQAVETDNLYIVLRYISADWASLFIGKGTKQKYNISDIDKDESYEFNIKWTPDVKNEHILYFSLETYDVNLEDNFIMRYTFVIERGPFLIGNVDMEFYQYENVRANIDIYNMGVEKATNVHAVIYDTLDINGYYIEYNKKNKIWINNSEYEVTASKGEKINISIENKGEAYLDEGKIDAIDGFLIVLEEVRDEGVLIEMGVINKIINADFGEIDVDKAIKKEITYDSGILGYHDLIMVIKADKNVNPNNLVAVRFNLKKSGPDLSLVFTGEYGNYIVNQLNNFKLVIYNEGNQIAAGADFSAYKIDNEGNEGLIFEKKKIEILPHNEKQIELGYIPRETGLLRMLWKVVLENDVNLKNNEYYINFGILPQSILNNLGNNVINGYLLIKIEKEDNGEWRDYQVVIDDLNEQLERTISPKNFIKLDELFNLKNIKIVEGGAYRVVAELRDSNNEVIKTKKDELKAIWEFSVIGEIKSECSKCGEGALNICDEEECMKLGDCIYDGRCTDSPINLQELLRGGIEENLFNSGTKTLSSIKEINACLIIKVNEQRTLSYNINSANEEVFVSNSNNLKCDGIDNEDLIISYHKFSGLQELAEEDSCDVLRKTNIDKYQFWESKFIKPYEKEFNVDCAPEFEQKYCNFIKQCATDIERNQINCCLE